MGSKTVLADVEGFTPLIDVLVEQYNGVLTAAVFGRVWRYCQGSYGDCKASLQTIADELGISYATTMRHIKALCADGYLEDRTPNLRNRPHTYADTGKVALQVSLKAGLSESKSTPPGGLSESKSHTIRKIDEDTTRDNKKRDNKKQTSQKPEKPDQWDLARKTKAVQDKARLPITYLSETVADLLGLAKVPNYQYEQRWEEPLRDLLDQADGDIDRVEVALRAAALEGHGNGMTMTTASSLHGLALKALAQTNGKDTTEDVEAREAAARAKMHELAREHGHE